MTNPVELADELRIKTFVDDLRRPLDRDAWAEFITTEQGFRHVDALRKHCAEMIIAALRSTPDNGGVKGGTDFSSGLCWQPMSSAPKDGTPFVFRRTGGGRLDIARWRGEEPREFDGRIYKREPGWVGQDEHCAWIIRDDNWSDRYEWSQIGAPTEPPNPVPVPSLVEGRARLAAYTTAMYEIVGVDFRKQGCKTAVLDVLRKLIDDERRALQIGAPK